eukprot:m.480403 g.480403  ORF g.480403 m.480403 type:complete len:313 (+) comp21827_c0_seq1:345-1283(+)
MRSNSASIVVVLAAVVSIVCADSVSFVMPADQATLDSNTVMFMWQSTRTTSGMLHTHIWVDGAMTMLDGDSGSTTRQLANGQHTAMVQLSDMQHNDIGPKESITFMVMAPDNGNSSDMMNNHSMTGNHSHDMDNGAHDHTDHTGTQGASHTDHTDHTTGAHAGHPQFFEARESVDFVLFEGWTATSSGDYAGALIFCFVLALFFEFFRFVIRPSVVLKLHGSSTSKDVYKANGAGLASAATPPPARSSAAWLVDTLFYGIQLTIGYFLMLLFMTFNLGLCLVIIIGAMLGYLLWADPAKIGDKNDNSHCSIV